MTGIIRKSSQVGMSKIALNLEPDSVRDVFFRAGLGRETGIGFPGEQSGIFPNRNRWTPIERANFGFGYGLSVNALQLAQGYLTLANNGVYKPIRLVKSDVVDMSEPVFDPIIVKDVTDMLKTVTLRGGTATSAAIKAYPVTGKTGTAHKVDEGGGYADDKYVAFFAGFAPADRPKLVGVVVVHEPPADGGYHGGQAAGPIFSKIVEKSLKVLNVVPADNAEYLTKLNPSVLGRG
jgi:cell division protein FtsI (penicillin-binding protein 3)